jgi:hypothetical protein
MQKSNIITKEKQMECLLQVGLCVQRLVLKDKIQETI